MQLVPLKCPSCGGDLEINPKDQFFKCPYCGVTSVTNDAIVINYVKNFNITILPDSAPDHKDFDIVAGTLKKYTGRNIDVIIPDDVISIGNDAFQSQSNLRSVVFPKDLKTIGSSAFHGCSSLNKVILPESLTNVYRYAFSRCTALKSVVIPKSVTHIGEFAFSNCTSLESIQFYDNTIEAFRIAFRSADVVL